MRKQEYINFYNFLKRRIPYEQIGKVTSEVAAKAYLKDKRIQIEKRKRLNAKIDLDLEVIDKLRQEGKSIEFIAHKLNVGKGTIANRLKEIKLNKK